MFKINKSFVLRSLPFLVFIIFTVCYALTLAGYITYVITPFVFYTFTAALLIFDWLASFEFENIARISQRQLTVSIVAYVLVLTSTALHFSITPFAPHMFFVITVLALWRIARVKYSHTDLSDYILQFICMTAVLLAAVYFRLNIFVPLVFSVGVFLYIINQHGLSSKMDLQKRTLYLIVGALTYIEFVIGAHMFPFSVYTISLLSLAYTYAYVYSARRIWL